MCTVIVTRTVFDRMPLKSRQGTQIVIRLRVCLQEVCPVFALVVVETLKTSLGGVDLNWVVSRSDGVDHPPHASALRRVISMIAQVSFAS